MAGLLRDSDHLSVYALKGSQILRLSSSDIAAIAGYHPFRNKLQLFEKYVYQDLDSLLKIDAENLGITIVSKEQEIADIINLLPPTDAAHVENLREKSKLRSITTDAAASKKHIECFNNLLGKESVTKLIPQRSLALLKDEILGEVRTRYGIDCESTALDRYEDHSGYTVVARNAETLVWPLYEHQYDSSSSGDNGAEISVTYNDTGVPENQARAVSNMRCSRFGLEHAVRSGMRNGSSFSGTAVPDRKDDIGKVVGSALSAFKSCSQTGSSCIAPESDSVTESRVGIYSAFIDLTSVSDNAKCADLCDDSDIKPPTALFYIVGKVDGLSTQLDLRSNDATQWREMQVVVEVKNRLGRIAAEPPLYDQIQLVTYMLMLGCQFGDLVQAVSSLKPMSSESISGAVPPAIAPGSSEPPHNFPASSATKVPRKRYFSSAAGDKTESSNGSTAAKRGSAASTADFAVSRVALNEVPYFHKDNFFGIIAPRLKIFRDAVLRLRAEDSLRYRWLLSPDEEKLELLRELCPYMRDAM